MVIMTIIVLILGYLAIGVLIALKDIEMVKQTVGENVISKVEDERLKRHAIIVSVILIILSAPIVEVLYLATRLIPRR